MLSNSCFPSTSKNPFSLVQALVRHSGKAAKVGPKPVSLLPLRPPSTGPGWKAARGWKTSAGSRLLGVPDGDAPAHRPGHARRAGAGRRPRGCHSPGSPPPTAAPGCSGASLSRRLSPTMVLESVVADLLNRFLGDYVENLNKSQLKLGIWGGKREGAAGGLPERPNGPTLRAPRPGSSPGPAPLASRDPASEEGGRRGPVAGRQVRGAERPVPASACPVWSDGVRLGRSAGSRSRCPSF